MKKCDVKSNRDYAKTITGVTVGSVGVLAGWQFREQLFEMLESLFGDNKVLVLPILLGVLLTASTSVIIDNKCTREENKNYGIASISIGCVALVAGIGFIVLTRKN